MLTQRNFSQLQPYSVGIVAVNKLLTEDTVEVVPLETASFMKGELTDKFDDYEGSGKTKTGDDFHVKTVSTLSVRAKWLPLGVSNRITSPDVRRGEHVMLYKLGDADEFYWTTLRQDKHIRRLETAIFSFSNNKDEDIEDDPETTYWMEVSTHKQLIHLHTSKNNKEPFIYDIQINTKDGRIIITDDDDNYIFMDSKERHIKLHNKDDSYVEMDKRIINISSQDEINLTTDRYTLKAKSSIDTETKKYTEKNEDYTMEASKTIKTTTDEHTVENTKYDTRTKEQYRVEAKRTILFETPRYEYVVDKMKMKIKYEFHAEVKKGDFKFAAPINHSGMLTSLITETEAFIPEVDIITPEQE